MLSHKVSDVIFSCLSLYPSQHLHLCCIRLALRIFPYRPTFPSIRQGIFTICTCVFAKINIYTCLSIVCQVWSLSLNVRVVPLESTAPAPGTLSRLATVPLATTAQATRRLTHRQMAALETAARSEVTVRRALPNRFHVRPGLSPIQCWTTNVYRALPGTFVSRARTHSRAQWAIIARKVPGTSGRPAPRGRSAAPPASQTSLSAHSAPEATTAKRPIRRRRPPHVMQATSVASARIRKRPPDLQRVTRTFARSGTTARLEPTTRRRARPAHSTIRLVFPTSLPASIVSTDTSAIDQVWSSRMRYVNQGSIALVDRTRPGPTLTRWRAAHVCRAHTARRARACPSRAQPERTIRWRSRRTVLSVRVDITVRLEQVTSPTARKVSFSIYLCC